MARAEDARSAPATAAEGKPRFANVGCSHCGRDFGPGDHGFSHCESHAPELMAARRIVQARGIEREAVYQHDALTVARALLASEASRMNMECALEEALEYFEDRSDVVDGDYGVPEANREMQLVTTLKDAITKVQS